MSSDRLKLRCGHGSFSVLLEKNGAQTVYTDYGGTSRTSTCTPMELLTFALAVVDFYSPNGSLKVKVGEE